MGRSWCWWTSLDFLFEWKLSLNLKSFSLLPVLRDKLKQRIQDVFKLKRDWTVQRILLFLHLKSKADAGDHFGDTAWVLVAISNQSFNWLENFFMWRFHWSNNTEVYQKVFEHSMTVFLLLTSPKENAQLMGKMCSKLIFDDLVDVESELSSYP